MTQMIAKGQIGMKKKIVFSLIILAILIPPTQVLCEANYDSAEELFNAGEYKKSSKLLKKVTKKDPSNKDAWLLLGGCYSRLGKDRSAAKAYQKVILIDPAHDEALFALGMSYVRLDECSAAIEAFKRVIENSPDHAKARFHLGVCYEDENRIEYAFEQYRILKTLDEKLADKLYRIIFW